MSRPTRSIDRAAIPGACPSPSAQIPDTGLHRDLEAERDRARGDGRGRGLARDLVGQRLVRCDAEQRRPGPRRGPRPGAGRADLRRHARSDRERDRRADRSDVRAARARSRSWPIWSTRPPTSEARFRTRRSRSSTASSISAGSRPMRCSWRSIPIRASRTSVFEPVVDAADPEDHPFAALKALQDDAPKLPSEEAERR